MAGRNDGGARCRKNGGLPHRDLQARYSPILGRRCRFHPTCSEYSQQALKLRGLKAGGAMALRRVAKCHPFNPGGYDPVNKQAAGHSNGN